MDFGPQATQNRTGLFTRPYCFVPPQSIAHPSSGVSVAPHGDSKSNGIGFIWSSDSKSQQMLSWKWCRVWRP